MLSFLLDLASGLMSWLAGKLPASPFGGLSLALSGVGNAIGWLNWVVPVSAMAQLLGVWLVAALVWQVVQFVTKRTTGSLSFLGKSG